LASVVAMILRTKTVPLGNSKLDGRSIWGDVDDGETIPFDTVLGVITPVVSEGIWEVNVSDSVPSGYLNVTTNSWTFDGSFGRSVGM